MCGSVLNSACTELHCTKLYDSVLFSVCTKPYRTVAAPFGAVQQRAVMYCLVRALFCARLYQCGDSKPGAPYVTRRAMPVGFSTILHLQQQAQNRTLALPCNLVLTKTLTAQLLQLGTFTTDPISMTVLTCEAKVLSMYVQAALRLASCSSWTWKAHSTHNMAGLLELCLSH